MAELRADALALAREGCPWEKVWLLQKKPFPGSWVPGGTQSQGNRVKNGTFRALILQTLLLCMLWNSSGSVGVSLAAVARSWFLFFPTAWKSPDFPLG